MAHYDCSDCGASCGIAYGYCTSCTPQEVIKAKKELDSAYKEAQRLWDKKHKKQKDLFIQNYVKSCKKHYEKLYDKYKPKKGFL